LPAGSADWVINVTPVIKDENGNPMELSEEGLRAKVKKMLDDSQAKSAEELIEYDAKIGCNMIIEGATVDENSSVDLQQLIEEFVARAEALHFI